VSDLAALRWVEVPCALCGATERDDVATNEAFPIPLRIRRCIDCGHVYLSPRPADEDLSSLYDEDYYAGAGEYGYADDRETPEIAAARARARLARIEELREPGRLLEVGCSFGAFLLAARERGWTVRGLDLSPVAVTACRERGLDVAEGTLETAAPPPASVDVVYLSETIEHLPDPRAAIRAAAGALRAGGLVVIGTGNHASLARVLRGAAWGYYMPGHLQYFTAASLARLLAEEGLAVVRRSFGDDRTVADLSEIRRLEGRPAGLRAALADRLRTLHLGGFSLGAGMVVTARKEAR
jgi:SAM-dependent methyltransferase